MDHGSEMSDHVPENADPPPEMTDHGCENVDPLSQRSDHASENPDHELEMSDHASEIVDPPLEMTDHGFENTDHRPEMSDHAPEIADPAPQTPDRLPQTGDPRPEIDLQVVGTSIHDARTADHTLRSRKCAGCATCRTQWTRHPRTETHRGRERVAWRRPGTVLHTEPCNWRKSRLTRSGKRIVFVLISQ